MGAKPEKKPEKPAKQGEAVDIIYDEQCPVCRFYCRNITPDNDTTAAALILMTAWLSKAQTDVFFTAAMPCIILPA